MEKGELGKGSRCVGESFTLNRLDEKVSRIREFMKASWTWKRVWRGYREALRQVLRILDGGEKLLNSTRCIYANSLASLRSKWVGSTFFLELVVM